MPRGVTFTIKQAKQIDFLMMYARRELNVTSASGKGSKGYHKLPGPGERFTYDVTCETCGVAQSRLPGSKYAVAFVVEHLGHKTDVTPPINRERDATELGDAARHHREKERTRGTPANAVRQRRYFMEGQIPPNVEVRPMFGRPGWFAEVLPSDVPHHASP